MSFESNRAGDTDSDIEVMAQGAIAELNRRILAAEEAYIINAIIAAGYDPSPAPDAEWRQHVTLETVMPGHKIIRVDGKARWAIVTDSGSLEWSADRMLVDYNVTVRMERIGG